MPAKILQEHINEQLDNRRRPLKRKKQEFIMIAVLGGILFLSPSCSRYSCSWDTFSRIFWMKRSLEKTNLDEQIVKVLPLSN